MVQMGCEDLLVGLGELRAHRLQVGVELLHVGDAGNGGVDLGILQDPLEGGHHGAVALQDAIGLLFLLNSAGAAGHDLHGDQADAGRFGFLDGRLDARIHGEVVAQQDHVDHPALDGGVDHRGLPAVGADTGEADLPVLLGGGLRFEQLGSQVGRARQAVQVPDIQVVGAQRAQAGFQVLHRPGLVPGVALARDIKLLALALQRGAHHALVIAALVSARGVEVVDAQVGGLLHHASVGGDHAAESDSSGRQSGTAELLVTEPGSGRRGRAGLGRRGILGCPGGEAGNGQRQAGGQEVASGRVHSSPLEMRIGSDTSLNYRAERS